MQHTTQGGNIEQICAIRECGVWTERQELNLARSMRTSWHWVWWFYCQCACQQKVWLWQRETWSKLANPAWLWNSQFLEVRIKRGLRAVYREPEHSSPRPRTWAHISWRTGEHLSGEPENISMFSTCSELTPRAPIPDGRMERFMHPWI